MRCECVHKVTQPRVPTSVGATVSNAAATISTQLAAALQAKGKQTQQAARRKAAHPPALLLA